MQELKAVIDPAAMLAGSSAQTVTMADGRFAWLVDGTTSVTGAVPPPVRRVGSIDRILQAVADTCWAILPSKLDAIIGLLELRARGIVLSDEEIQERVGAAAQAPQPQTRAGIAVLPLFGTVSQRANIVTNASGGTSTDLFGKAFDAAVKDPSVSAIVLDVDSPGGSVYGVGELSQRIFDARGKKPIVAAANSMAASAAYWIATSADELFVTPGGEVGSIGVLAAHIDESRAEEAMGIKTTLVSAGKYKAEASPHEPLQAEARAYLQSRVDDYYAAFTRAVARNRGATVEEVRSGFGEGRMVGARSAVEGRMADRIGTLDDAVRRAAQLSGRPLTRSAAAARKRLELLEG